MTSEQIKMAHAALGWSIDQLADEAGTIGYEILTSLGNRYNRSYTGV